jgi:Ulp1 family protease
MGYSKEYKENIMNVFRKLKNRYREPIQVYWCEITHLLSKHLHIKLYGEQTTLHYEREIYKKYLVDCGVIFEESSPTKKRKRYNGSYVPPTKIKKTKLYNSRFAPLSLREETVIENKLVDSEYNVLIEKFNIPMTRQTIMEIYENQWLSDDVVDFYMKMLNEHDMEMCMYDKTRRSSHYYSCYFMTLLLPPNGYNYNNVKGWSKKFNVFEKEKIFCPINVNASHWSMLVIYIQEKMIAYYDSMQVHGKKYLDAALQYLVDESLTMNRPFDKEQWTLITYTDGLPLQENDYDCGVFALMYADFITDDLPLVFGQQHMELFRKKMCVAIMRGSFSYPSSVLLK